VTPTLSARDQAHEGLAAAALRGARPIVLDGGGAFDPYRVAEAARRRGVEPDIALNRILVARAFTAYQELRLLLRLAAWRDPVHAICLLNPLFVFTDPDLPALDRPWLIERMLAGIQYLLREGRSVTVFQQGSPFTSLDLRERLAARLPWRLEAGGGLIGGSHGQERFTVFPGHRPAGRPVRALSARVARGGQAAAG